MSLKSLNPGVVNITCHRGASFHRSITGITVDSLALDITSMDIEMQVRAKKSSTDTIVSLDNDTLGGITITDGSLGAFDIDLTPSQTSDLDEGSFYYDIKISDSTEAARVLEGTFTVDPEVTR